MELRKRFETKTKGCDENFLYVCNTSDIGRKESLKNPLSLTGVEVPVQVNKDVSFRLIPVRLPYALTWSGIYGLILEMGGFVGRRNRQMYRLVSPSFGNN